MSEKPTIPGLHHVTAMTSSAQKNVDFYQGLLGLRLVKVTVNFDDPGSYHLYYGDELGRPGTALTFFVWEGAYRGRIGPAQVTTTSFLVQPGAIGFWVERLKAAGVKVTGPEDRFGESVIAFTDFDGMQLEIVGSSIASTIDPWKSGPVPADQAIRGFHSVTLSEEGYEHTARMLTDVMGYTRAGESGNRFRFLAAPGKGLACYVDVLCSPDAPHGRLGTGIVHHVAFRVADDAAEGAMLSVLNAGGANVSPVMDRVYFHSIYYREPGGVLFEIATDVPGFTQDEPVDKLGQKLQLPPWLEKHRDQIQAALPPIKLPG